MNPKAFDASCEAPLYDYFLVRSETDRTAELFGHATEPIELDAHDYEVALSARQEFAS